MRVTKDEHGQFLVQIKDEERHYDITIWNKDSLNPIGRLFANQRFTGDLRGAQRRAAEMLTELGESAAPFSAPELHLLETTHQDYATK